ncbi:MAG TPA: hydantoinase/oxoprolinase N-terminal domain-containing protein [Alphaproteobacteria bacterium]|nr:hydantoinase/oxoprolinase N-terminal domain-containing protein [Alphaproteobacteria bacterium]
MTTRIGIDVGSTFTDFVLVDSQRRYIAKGKDSTTPHAPSVDVLEGLDVWTSRHNRYVNPSHQERVSAFRGREFP